MEKRRVVITGLGILSPVGNSVDEVWNNISTGQSGIDTITLFDYSEFENHIAGEVKNFDATTALSRKDVRRTDRVTHFSVAACRQALDDSGLVITDDNRFDVGCSNSR